ncbi:hypothetical protein FSP39_004045 [Pinctada imbricata]|uniref:Uncharacterized protein n=1 Tax=Pinctada imbricata TaxID=66713 RepID=A0AA88XYK7_PINIB|nr:hypothetical protein FSP39_004045 [Pinctada imbricata]
MTSWTDGYHEYCIIGAGPAGLQMGYYLQRDKRDYVIYEQSDKAGSFFKKYPRHRKLISINKVNTGSNNKEFNMRHDWNSLLSDDDRMLFKQFSREMFPHADVMTRYLQTFASHFDLNIQYNTQISDIESIMATGGSTSYFRMKNQEQETLTCRIVIIATGLWLPNIPRIPGINLTEGYEDISTDPEQYNAKSVLILGRGNSAFETADAMYDRTNFIHMVGRNRIRLAWETHYVGDLRAVNNGLLDTYQLKSLDGLLEYDLSDYKVVKKHGKLFLEENVQQERHLAEEYDNDPLLMPYDKIIRCLGFKFDKSIFRNESSVEMNSGRASKYPVIDHDYRSPSVDGLYYAGTIAHSLDYRLSAGGFIHGFRYSVKRTNEAAGIYQMYSVLGDIIIVDKDRGTFAYYEEYPIQLLHKFTEVTGANVTNKGVFVITLQYGQTFKGPKEDVFRVDRAATSPRFGHLSNFLHPVIYFYKAMPDDNKMTSRKKRELLPKPDGLHHMVEDFNTDWSRPVTHVIPLRAFIGSMLNVSLAGFSQNECFLFSLSYDSLPQRCLEYLSTCSKI